MKNRRIPMRQFSRCAAIAIALFLVLNIAPPLVGAANAECQLNDTVEIIATGGRNMMLYWEERPCDPESSVKYQTSSDGGETWSVVNTMTTSSEIGSVEDFDGVTVLKSRGRLIAGFVVVEDGSLKLKVMTSDNFGRAWSGPNLVWDVSDDLGNPIDLTGCPALTTTYSAKLRVLTLHTVVIDGGGIASTYVVRSLDEGGTWEAPQELGRVPTFCDD